MKELKIKDNQYRAKTDFFEVRSVTDRIADKTLEQLEKDGVFVTDNVLQDGDIIESRFAVERRNRTIHSRMRDYLYELKHHKVLETSIIPLGDGVALSTKVREE